MKTPIWASGLSTRAKAARATKWGGVACLLAAARKMLAAVIMVTLSQKSWDHAIAWLLGAGIIPVFIAIAGVRLLHGRGQLTGCIAVLLIILDVAMAGPLTATAQLITSVAVTTALLLFIINGVRGAFALRYVDFGHELRETFD